MPWDFSNFLDALATLMASATGLAYATMPRALWRDQAVENSSANPAICADPYSVLRIYAGALPWVPVPSLSIQCKTTATTLADGWTQANALFGSLLDGGLRSVRMLSVPAVNGGPNYRLNGADPRPPALLGRDERGRGEIVFNFSAEIVKLS